MINAANFLMGIVLKISKTETSALSSEKIQLRY